MNELLTVLRAQAAPTRSAGSRWPWLRALLALVAFVVIASPASAQESSGGLGFIGDWMSDGGEVMWIILTVSIVGTVVFLERAFDLYIQQRLRAKSFLASVLGHLEARQYRRAYDACTVRSRHPLVAVVRAGVMRANRREKEIERAMEKEMLGALPRLQKRVALLGLLANAATLMGLLGTIFGLISAFNSVAMATAAERQEALAGGISEAMYTTAFGISVAVPMLFFHHFLSKRTERILMEVEEGASSVLVALGGTGDKQDGRASGLDDMPPGRGDRGAAYGASRRA